MSNELFLSNSPFKTGETSFFNQTLYLNKKCKWMTTLSRGNVHLANWLFGSQELRQRAHRFIRSEIWIVSEAISYLSMIFSVFTSLELKKLRVCKVLNSLTVVFFFFWFVVFTSSDYRYCLFICQIAWFWGKGWHIMTKFGV